jgi:hypothetical protein
VGAIDDAVQGAGDGVMPSCTVPMFSKMPATSHITQSDIARMRMTRAMATGGGPA